MQQNLNWRLGPQTPAVTVFGPLLKEYNDSFFSGCGTYTEHTAEDSANAHVHARAMFNTIHPSLAQEWSTHNTESLSVRTNGPFCTSCVE